MAPLSRCVVHQLIKFMDMQSLSRAEIRVFSQRMSLLGFRFCIFIDTVHQLVWRMSSLGHCINLHAY